MVKSTSSSKLKTMLMKSHFLNSNRIRTRAIDRQLTFISSRIFHSSAGWISSSNCFQRFSTSLRWLLNSGSVSWQIAVRRSGSLGQYRLPLPLIQRAHWRSIHRFFSSRMFTSFFLKRFFNSFPASLLIDSIVELNIVVSSALFLWLFSFSLRPTRRKRRILFFFFGVEFFRIILINDVSRENPTLFIHLISGVVSTVRKWQACNCSAINSTSIRPDSPRTAFTWIECVISEEVRFAVPFVNKKRR